MSLSLNPAQQALVCAVIKHMRTDIDWDAVAKNAGVDSMTKARPNWGYVRGKIIATSGGDGGEDAGTRKSKKTRTSAKKRKNGDDETPAKKKVKKTTPPGGGDNEEDGGKDLIKQDEEDTKGAIKPDPADGDDLYV